jgi:hypothetical protein
MSTTDTAPLPTTLDLTGLPPEVVQTVVQLVSFARRVQAAPTATGPQSERPPLRGRFSEPAPEYTPEMFKRDRLEAWANFPRDFPTGESS